MVEVRKRGTGPALVPQGAATKPGKDAAKSSCFPAHTVFDDMGKALPLASDLLFKSRFES